VILKKFGHGVKCCGILRPAMQKQHDTTNNPAPGDTLPAAGVATGVKSDAVPAGEVGGPQGLEPTRYGDWEKQGRCIDF
jgi:hypothetical protein